MLLVLFPLFIRIAFLFLFVGKYICWIIFVEIVLKFLRQTFFKSLYKGISPWDFFFFRIFKRINITFSRILLIGWSYLWFLIFLWSIIKSLLSFNFTDIWVKFILRILAFSIITTTFNGDLINLTKLNCIDLVIDFFTFQIKLFFRCQCQFFRDISLLLITWTNWSDWFLRFDIIFNILAHLHCLELQRQRSS